MIELMTSQVCAVYRECVAVKPKNPDVSNAAHFLVFLRKGTLPSPAHVQLWCG